MKISNGNSFFTSNCCTSTFFNTYNGTNLWGNVFTAGWRSHACCMAVRIASKGLSDGTIVALVPFFVFVRLLNSFEQVPTCIWFDWNSVRAEQRITAMAMWRSEFGSIVADRHRGACPLHEHVHTKFRPSHRVLSGANPVQIHRICTGGFARQICTDMNLHRECPLLLGREHDMWPWTWPWRTVKFLQCAHLPKMAHSPI